MCAIQTNNWYCTGIIMSDNISDVLHSRAMDEIIYNTTNYPVTLCLIIIQLFIYLYILNYSIDMTSIAYQYNYVVRDKQYYRIYTSTFTHLSIYHIGFNMYSLWSLRSIELQYTSVTYIIYTLLLINGSMLILTIMSYVLVRLDYRQYADQLSVGYSCVVFGIMSIQSVQYDIDTKFNLFGMIELPYILSPLISLLITQLIIRNASLIGHLAGIVIGYIIGLGVFDVLNNMIGLIVLLISSSLLLIISLVGATDVHIPFISTCIEQYQQRNNPQSKLTIVNGNIVYRAIPTDEQV